MIVFSSSEAGHRKAPCLSSSSGPSVHFWNPLVAEKSKRLAPPSAIDDSFKKEEKRLVVVRQKNVQDCLWKRVLARDLTSQSTVPLKELLKMNPRSTRAYLLLEKCRSQSIQMCVFHNQSSSASSWELVGWSHYTRTEWKRKSEHMIKQSGDLFVWKQWWEPKTITLFVFILESYRATVVSDSTLGCATAILDDVVWSGSEALGWNILHGNRWTQSRGALYKCTGGFTAYK